MESVQCASCSSQYDSLEHTFCPRCGTTERDKAIATVQAAQPKLREQKMRRAGLILIVIGAMSALLFGFLAVGATQSMGEWSEPIFAQQDGGQLNVLAAANATVMVRNGDGELLMQGQTNANGTYQAQVPIAFVNVTVAAGGQEWYRDVLILEGFSETIHINAGDATTADVQGGTGIIKMAIGILVLFAILYGILAFLGFQLLRGKALGMALAAAALAMIPAILMLIASMNIGSMLIAGSLLYAVATLVRLRQSN